MDTQFGQSITYGTTAISSIALPQAVHSAVYMSFCNGVFQVFHVLPENVRLLYLLHSYSVIYKLRLVKRIFKEIPGFLR
jgi:hypothetical protein